MSATAGRPAIFLDRDGVLNEEMSLADGVPPALSAGLKMFGWVPAALRALESRGFELVVVSNQTAVARGLLSPAEVESLNDRLFADIATAGGPALKHFFYCPHHPNATLPGYRAACECRKPRPGLLTTAAKALDLDLLHSFMIGDRLTDVMAGAHAGCKTILVESGAHREPLIETVDPIDPTDASLAPEWVFPSLREATDWVITYGRGPA